MDDPVSAEQASTAATASAPPSVTGLLDEVRRLSQAARLHARALEILSTLLSDRRVWIVMAGGRHGTLIGGPFGSAEDAESGREALIDEATADGQWGRIHPDVDSARELYQVHEYDVEYPLGWREG